MKLLASKKSRFVFFIFTLFLFFAFISIYEASADVKIDNKTDLSDYWSSNIVSQKGDNKRVVGKEFVLRSSKYALEEIYGIKVILRGSDAMNGPLDIYSDTTEEVNEIWGNDYEWNDSITIKLSESSKDGLCSFTYKSEKPLFSSKDKKATVYIGQYWPYVEDGDIVIYDLILLGKSGKTIGQIHCTELKSEETLFVGVPTTLKVSNPTGSVVWSSSNTKVATVDKNGKVTPKKNGKCVITAKVGKKKYKCKVSVRKAEINCSSVSLPLGETFSLSVNGTKAKSWFSDDSKTVTVSKSGVITAKRTGSATVKVKCSNGKTYSCKVTVFDQNNLLSPNYKTILTDMKSNVEKVLKSDQVTFVMDWFGNTNRSEEKDYLLDANMFDLMADEVKVKVDYTVLEEDCVNSLVFSVAQLIDSWDGNLTRGFFRETEINTKIGKHSIVLELSKDDVEDIKTTGSVYISLYSKKAVINKVVITGKPVKSFDAVYANADSPVNLHGKLVVEGTQVVDEKGEPYRLIGTDFAWNQLALEYGNSKSVYSFYKLWGANCVRIGEHAETEGGYASKEGNKAEILHFVENMIDACIETGLYAIVDWHCFYNPLTYSDEAVEFFSIISEKYAGCPNVIYEICNEPCPDESTPEEDDTWDIVKQYANKVIPVIRMNSPEAMIVVGGPSWSNDVLVRAGDPLKYDNIIYTDHIYASTHDDFVDVEKAINMGLPILITEMSPTEADGSSNPDYNSCDKWFALLDKYNVGYFYWNFWSGDATALKSGIVKRYDWTESDYSEVGAYMYHNIRKAAGLENKN